MEKPVDEKEIPKEMSAFEKLALRYSDDIQETNLAITSLISSVQTRFVDVTTFAATPYEKYKQIYLDPSEPVLTIEQLPPPKHIALKEIIPLLSATGIGIPKNFVTNNLPYITAGNFDAGSTMFTTVSNGIVMHDKEKLKEHFVFMELIKNMTPQDINERPLSTALKLINEFIRIYNVY